MFSHSGLEIHFAEIENDLMTLSAMMRSPHSVEFRLQMEDWFQLLQDLGRMDIQMKKKILRMYYQVQKHYEYCIIFCFPFQY